jgi:beta-phosphoglucomutase-like phosphatase (HAD superfamily)
MDSIPNPLDSGRRIRAVLFDLDGTLYHQSRLRALMMVELMALPLAGPFQAPRRWRALAAYREAMEDLRVAAPNGSVPAAQVKAAAVKAGLPIGDVERLVDDWMMKRPLKYLMRCRVAGIAELLDALAARASVPACCRIIRPTPNSKRSASPAGSSPCSARPIRRSPRSSRTRAASCARVKSGGSIRPTC